MAVILLRDDDANATTCPARLARCYAPLLEAGLPLALSVIPEVALDTRAPDGGRERFLSESSPDQAVDLPLTRGSPLAGFLREHPAQLEVLQHGLSHRRRREGTELGSLDHAEAAQLIARGRATLETALGARPQGFVAPWDALSRGSLEAAASAFPLVSTGFVDRRRLPPRAWPAHALERAQRSEALPLGSTWVLRHRGALIDRSTRPDQVPALLDRLSRSATVAVVVLHHWSLWGEGDPAPAVVALARALRHHRVVGVRAALAHLRDQPARRGLRQLAERLVAP